MSSPPAAAARGSRRACARAPAKAAGVAAAWLDGCGVADRRGRAPRARRRARPRQASLARASLPIWSTTVHGSQDKIDAVHLRPSGVCTVSTCNHGDAIDFISSTSITFTLLAHIICSRIRPEKRQARTDPQTTLAFREPYPGHRCAATHYSAGSSRNRTNRLPLSPRLMRSVSSR